MMPDAEMDLAEQVKARLTERQPKAQWQVEWDEQDRPGALNVTDLSTGLNGTIATTPTRYAGRSGRLPQSPQVTVEDLENGISDILAAYRQHVHEQRKKDKA